MDGFSGVVPIMPTPFDETGGLDIESLLSLTEFLIGSGVDGIAVCGVASEGYALTDVERRNVIETVSRASAGLVPVLAGAGHHSAEAGAQLAREAEAAGADGLLVMPPHFVKPTDSSLVQYFSAIDAAVGIPIMIQDNPQWTGVALSVDLLSQLAELPNVASVKVESVHPPSKMRQLRLRIGDGLDLYGGLAGNWLPEELACGSSGTMPAALMPSVFAGIWHTWKRGDQAAARQLFHRYHPAIRVTAQQSVGFAMVKWLLYQLEVIKTPRVRSPLQPLSEEDLRDLLTVCDELELLDVMKGTV